MFVVPIGLPKDCGDCYFCYGEYGKGNEKSYCCVSDLCGSDLKYKGKRPVKCPLKEYKKGEWIIEEEYNCHSDIVKTYTCPFCNLKHYEDYPFCNCGAYMRKENEDES